MSGKTISINSQVLRWNDSLNRWSLSELEVDNYSIDLYNTEEGILETFNLNDLSMQSEQNSQKKIKLSFQNGKKEIIKFLNVPDKEIIMNFYNKIAGNDEKMEDIKLKRESKINKELTNEEIEELKKSPYYLEGYLNLKNRNSIPLELKFPENYSKEVVKTISSKIFPVTFNEPINMLQKYCEQFQNIYLLKQVSLSKDDEKRIIAIFQFLLEESDINVNRTLKPFNPLAGETYEYYDKNNNFRYFSEQVEHKPNTISAFICESDNIKIFGDTHYDTAFAFLKGGMSLNFVTKTHVLFLDDNKEFVYNKPIVFIKGVLTGKLTTDYSGLVEIYSDKGEIGARINFEENTGEIKGGIYNKNDLENPIGIFKGNWKNIIKYVKFGKESVIWEKDNNLKIGRYDLNSLNYPLNFETLKLNEINDELKKFLPISDSRFRPDIQIYENGDLEKTEEVKKKLEEKQRVKFKDLEDKKEEYKPKYFKKEKNELSNDEVYVYCGDYFEERKKGDFGEMPNLFEYQS
jgi:hypothetical protein